MTRFYAMLNAEKITTGKKKKITAGLQLKIRILLLKKKKKKILEYRKITSFFLPEFLGTHLPPTEACFKADWHSSSAALP